MSSSNTEPQNIGSNAQKTLKKLRWEKVSMAVIAKQQQSGLLTGLCELG